jgi:hypothetical protein
LFLGLAVMAGSLEGEAVLYPAWVLGLLLIPVLSPKRQRAGDLIGGTMVVSMPSKALLPDLTAVRAEERPYVFTADQLGVYGNLELQALEALLREAESGSPSSRANSLAAFEMVAGKICRKIGYPWPPPRGDEHRFLKDFYLAERDLLEKALILGRRKESKLSPLVPVGRPPDDQA